MEFETPSATLVPSPEVPGVVWHPLRYSAAHQLQAALGATFSERAGWVVPELFSSHHDELLAVREQAGLVDLSYLGKLSVLGSSSADWLLSVGQSSSRTGLVGELPVHLPPRPDGDGATNRPVSEYGAAGYLEGRVLSLCLVHDEFLLLTGPSTETQLEAMLSAQPRVEDGHIHWTSVTSDLAALAVAGPCARDVLRQLTAIDVRHKRFPDWSCTQGIVAKIRACIARIDRADIPIFLLLVDRGYGEYLWEALLRIGQPFGLKPIGCGTWDALESAG